MPSIQLLLNIAPFFLAIRGGRAAVDAQQEADGDGEGGPDGGAPRPARRAGQARRLRGGQGRREVQERQTVGRIWTGLTSSFQHSGLTDIFGKV